MKGQTVDVRAFALVGLGAGIGGMFRFAIAQFVGARFGATQIPYATLFINVSGSFLIGVVIEASLGKAGLSPLWRAFLATGILGGYTTFSTFSFEALSLGTGGFPLVAVLYVAASVVLGIAAAYAGIATARAAF
jgi:CrcB protein